MEKSKDSNSLSQNGIEEELQQEGSSINDTQAGVIWAASFLALALCILLYTDDKTGPAVFIGFALYTLYKIYKEAKLR